MLDALEDIRLQSHKIDKVFVVDNGEDKLVKYIPYHTWDDEPSPRLEIRDYGKNIGTNAVWNLGLRTKADFVMFFPDDMRFDHDFVKKCIYTFNDPNVAVVSAKIIPWEEELPKGKENEFRCGRTCGHGKAGVFMIRGSVARELPLIPKEYFIFFGDDWIDFHVRLRMRKIWTELRWSCARHDYGSGVSAYLKKTVLKEEREHWYKFLEENNEGRLPFRQ
jgi:hypothetical protein